jgi:hypothetical protein
VGRCQRNLSAQQGGTCANCGKTVWPFEGVTVHVEAQLLDNIRNGQTIDAIKFLRSVSGRGLADAKWMIEHMHETAGVSLRDLQDAHDTTSPGESVAPDVEERVKLGYPPESVLEVMQSLAKYQGPERNRVIRCIIHLSGGDPQRISHFAGVAAEDYRDVILWAEYDAKDRQVHDFSKPFVQT